MANQILQGILEATQDGVRRRNKQRPPSQLVELSREQPPPLDFASALRGREVKLIGEVKRASPSRGLLCKDFDPARLARLYNDNGVAAISILTEETYFQGRLEYLTAVRHELQASPVPLLRKDFILDPYQVHESRAFGSDAILLIVAILTDRQLDELLAASHEMGMGCLVEVHDREQLDRALSSGAAIIGINNRDLHSFRVDLTVTERLCSFIPSDRTIVSESGIHSRDDMETVGRWGVNAVLVGEALVTAADVGGKVRELIGQS